MQSESHFPLGAHCISGQGTHFLVWAPFAEAVTLWLGDVKPRKLKMSRGKRGYYSLLVSDAKSGAKYRYQLDANPPLPDPASRYQPEGVHGPSEVVDASFAWSNSTLSRGRGLCDLIIYELHVGTFTQKGTLAAIVDEIPRLQALGITAIELMPLAQFPGQRNWGYDGVYPFAVQNSYGGPHELKMLVDACHASDISVILDVVYNHLGPEGNYLAHYGPYFQDRYQTPWGSALNFDGPYSDEVRRYFLQNMMQWLDEFHIDGLRLDAVHAICDFSAKPFLEELTRAKRELEQKTGSTLHLIAESDSNDSRLVGPLAQNHIGMDAQWSDDYHHALHAKLTGERHGYYQDFGNLDQIVKALNQRVVYDGQFSPFRNAKHGRSYLEVDFNRLVVCSQNHDQIGNRMLGERLSTLIDHHKLKLAASLILLSPFTPLLFMGEEYGEKAPFLYFADHSDAELIRATREGRAKEFRAFFGDKAAPDPFSVETFDKSRIEPDSVVNNSTQRDLLTFYQALVTLRKVLVREGFFANGKARLLSDEQTVHWHGQNKKEQIHSLFSFSDKNETIGLPRGSKKLSVALQSFDSPSPSSSDEEVVLPPFSVIVLRG
jgi:maltooligosyltrehalose trehalohydrolase